MKKKSHLFRNIILFIISALFLLSFSYYIYTTYSNIEMSSEYDISKISTSNNSVSTTTNLDISNMLEDVSNCVVAEKGFPIPQCNLILHLFFQQVL